MKRINVAVEVVKKISVVAAVIITSSIFTGCKFRTSDSDVKGGKTTDAPRRALIKKLPKADEQFLLIEKKSDSRAVLFEWLDTVRGNLDLEDEHCGSQEVEQNPLNRSRRPAFQ